MCIRDRTNNDVLQNPSSFGDTEFLSATIYFGRRIAKNSAFGIRSSYDRSNSQFISFSNQVAVAESPFTSTAWQVGLFYRQYLKIKNNLFIILEPNASYSNLDRDEETQSETEKGINIGIDIIPQYRIADRWNLFVILTGLDFDIVENNIKIQGGNRITEDNNDFSFEFRLRDIQLGAEWLF